MRDGTRRALGAAGGSRAGGGLLRERANEMPDTRQSPSPNRTGPKAALRASGLLTPDSPLPDGAV